MITMGQAVDAAVKKHGELYHHSEVYAARVAESSTITEAYKVELSAVHFSVKVVYNVNSTTGEIM